jgi:hypothetical protein
MKRFFADEKMNFALLYALGAAQYQASDIGECLTVAERVGDGDFGGWIATWSALATRLATEAAQSAAHGHRESARKAYLRASLYYDLSSSSGDFTGDSGAYSRYWRLHRDAWDKAAACFDPPLERLAIPYEGTVLEGWMFKRDASSEPRPTIVLNNGSDGPITATWSQGGAAALARGWNAVAFDGPGQGAALNRLGLPFRHDWEVVISAVIDHLLTRSDVDRDKIVLHGVSQAGYWVPRAAAFERRLAACVADPGVVDVSSAWLEGLPKEMRDLLEADAKDEFDAYMAEGLAQDPRARAMLAWRMRPYGTASYFDAYQRARAMRLTDDLLGQIRCPTLVTDPDDEQFWPGQSQKLYEQLRCDSMLLRFRAEEGADGHCEPAALALRDQRIFDWLEETLGLTSANSREAVRTGT